jgi:hypothetical protein
MPRPAPVTIATRPSSNPMVKPSDCPYVAGVTRLATGDGG